MQLLVLAQPADTISCYRKLHRVLPPTSLITPCLIPQSAFSVTCETAASSSIWLLLISVIHVSMR